MGILAEHYKWPIEIKEIEETMAFKDIKHVVTQQAELNEEDDFLLLPLRLVLQLLSQTTGAVIGATTGSAATSSSSPKSGMSAQ